MQVLFEIMLQIKQKRGIGVENTSPRNFSDGLALSSSEFVTYMRALTPSPDPQALDSHKLAQRPGQPARAIILGITQFVTRLPACRTRLAHLLYYQLSPP